MAGQRLAFGFPGTTLSREFKELVREYRAGSVILFRENIVSSRQLRSLCGDIQELILEVTGQPAFIGIDQEGGMVTRLSPDLVNVPGNMAASAAGDPDTAYRLACITSRQMRGTGLNFNLAPAVDVNSNPANPVIGVRSYGDDPSRTAAFGAAAVRGYLKNGIMCCGKHFPGHGDTAVDSHRGLPLINKSLEELWKTELPPFQAVIDAGVPAMMSSHILFPQIEPDLPATMSRRIMHGLLRDEMGFGGLIISDTMEMDAIRRFYGSAAGTVQAMKAGIDIVAVCHGLQLQRESAEAVLDAMKSGEISAENTEEAYYRILDCKSKYAFTQTEPELAGKPEDFEEMFRTAAAAAVLYEGTPRPLFPDTFFCGPKDYRMTNVANTDAYGSDFVSYMQKRFAAPGMLCGADPSAEEIALITAEAKKHRAVVLGTCNAHLFRGQLALAEALNGTGLPLTVIALRNPYDLPEISAGPVKLAVFDYTLGGLHAAEEFLKTGIAPGRMPVRL